VRTCLKTANQARHSDTFVLALAMLLTANPLRAVGACLLFAPWLVLAYYTDPTDLDSTANNFSAVFWLHPRTQSLAIHVHSELASTWRQ